MAYSYAIVRIIVAVALSPGKELPTWLQDGQLDCSSMDYVPFCGVSLEEKCGRTYTVQSGIGDLDDPI